ncbi:AEC family transporter [Pseudomonas sp. GCM10022188]|uniref:AEC family transporter n=1 Tax=Pseudomonas TaxID=286 RepID=UPI001E51F443|nr:AEC family transporter [Pseudomonas oryzagri]MCC6075762.1 AEC family transporter [Pseudomonas oryzagri]
MSSVLNVLLPIFGLILAGYLCRRSNRLGPTAASEINRFVVWLGLPALLFGLTARADWAAIWQPGFLLAFTAGTLAVFGLTLLWRWRAGVPLADASIDGLSAAYANTGYLGIPLCLLVLGDDGMAPALIASLIVVCLLFGLALVCIEVALQAGAGFARAVRQVLLALLKNPLVVAPLLGAAWGLGGVPLPAALERFLQLLGGATVPCALVSLGLFLAQPQPAPRPGALPLVALKLVLQPLLTWLIAFVLLDLPPLWAHAALLLSALPTGTGPFMLAEYYRRDAALVSRTILLSTLGSLVSLSLLLVLLGH